MNKATSKENELKQNVDTTIKIMKDLADPSADVSILDLLDLVSSNLSQGYNMVILVIWPRLPFLDTLKTLETFGFLVF